MAWQFETDPAFEERLTWLDRFVRERIWPLESIVGETPQPDLDRAYASLRGDAKAAGLWAPHLPPELGGQGFGQVKLALIHEILGSSPLAPEAFGCQAPDSGNSEILALAGSEEQKRRWLEPLLAGRLRSAFSMTEPDSAGSDPTGLQATATRDGDGWRLRGTKWFTTNGSIADFLIVMAVTDPDAAPHLRASMFIVPADSPGVEVLRDVPTMSHPQESFGRVANHAEISYDDVALPAAALLGEPGEGFKIAQQRLGPGRIHHCMRWLGVSRRAFDMLCERALSRQAQGGTLAQKQTVQNWIADSAAEMRAARLMTLEAAWIMDRDGAAAARTEISTIKFFGAKVLHDVLDRALQVHGALGYSTDLPLEAMYREARAARILDGPDEVHRQTVARQILRRREPAAGAVPTEHVPSRRPRARQLLAELTAGAAAGEPV
jgi:acyl-CoA dehydrogenase